MIDGSLHGSNEERRGLVALEAQSNIDVHITSMFVWKGTSSDPFARP